MIFKYFSSMTDILILQIGPKRSWFSHTSENTTDHKSLNEARKKPNK